MHQAQVLTLVSANLAVWFAVRLWSHSVTWDNSSCWATPFHWVAWPKPPRPPTRAWRAVRDQRERESEGRVRDLRRIERVKEWGGSDCDHARSWQRGHASAMCARSGSACHFGSRPPMKWSWAIFTVEPLTRHGCHTCCVVLPFKGPLGPHCPVAQNLPTLRRPSFVKRNPCLGYSCGGSPWLGEPSTLTQVQKIIKGPVLPLNSSARAGGAEPTSSHCERGFRVRNLRIVLSWQSCPATKQHKPINASWDASVGNQAQCGACGSLWDVCDFPLCISPPP